MQNEIKLQVVHLNGKTFIAQTFTGVEGSIQIAEVTKLRNKKATEQNANLLAASREMLTACKAAIALLPVGFCTEQDAAFDMLNSAIRNADRRRTHKRTRKAQTFDSRDSRECKRKFYTTITGIAWQVQECDAAQVGVSA